MVELHAKPDWAITPDKIDAVRRIVETAHPQKVILFGSVLELGLSCRSAPLNRPLAG
jgi:hypothetical protein